jgi:putative hydrolase
MLNIDLHIHTIASGHAYIHLNELINYAKDNKMSIVGINDHGTKISGKHIIPHFGMAFRCPKFENLKILWGCEANIIDEEGNIDLMNPYLSKLDYLSIGIHPPWPKVDDQLCAILNCFKKHKPLFMTHPYIKLNIPDVSKLYQLACEHDVILELNLSVLTNPRLKKETLVNIKKMIEIVKKNKKKLIINSDAHFLHEVGDDSILERYYADLGLTPEIIINNYPEELLKRLKK